MTELRTCRLSSLLRGAVEHSGDDGGHALDERRRHVAYERDLLEADKENEQMRAELSTLESQVVVLQGALTAINRILDDLLKNFCSLCSL